MERTRCGAGLGQDADLLVAAEQAAADARVMLGSGRPDLAAVFVCGHDPDDAAAALIRAGELTGARTVLGCTAPGVIGGGRGIEMASAVSIFVAQLPDVTLRSFHLEVLRTSESIAVMGLPPQRADQRRAVLLADPWSFPVDAFVGQSPDVLRGLTLSGGLAVGFHGAGSTRLLVDGVIHDRGAVGVVLSGDLASTAVVSQGCRPVGPVMTVTAAEGNAVLELAGSPAITKLEEIVSGLPPEEQALVSAGVHLGIAMDEYADEHSVGDFLVRGLAGADPARKALLVGDVVPVGCTVQFQVRDAGTADEDLRSLLRSTYGPTSSAPAGALVFACTGRGAGMFSTADHDAEVIRSGLRGAPVAGFFAAGEIGPVAGRTHLHTMTASVLSFDAPDDLQD